MPVTPDIHVFVLRRTAALLQPSETTGRSIGELIAHAYLLGMKDAVDVANPPAAS
jgi:hypothetical protein